MVTVTMPRTVACSSMHEIKLGFQTTGVLLIKRNEERAYHMHIGEITSEHCIKWHRICEKSENLSPPVVGP